MEVNNTDLSMACLGYPSLKDKGMHHCKPSTAGALQRGTRENLNTFLSAETQADKPLLQY